MLSKPCLLLTTRHCQRITDPRYFRRMATISTASSNNKTTHIERTASQPRDPSLHRAILSRVEQINPSIRLLGLTPISSEKEGNGRIKHLPGQWLDVHIPSLAKPGGFTITSPPSTLLTSEPYLELAVQKTDNPPAAWLHRPEKDILGKELGIRVGGSFIWDDKEWESEKRCKKVVFIAGGVGINPFMSMLSHISEVATERKLGFEIKFLYSVRDPGPARNAGEILFLPRLNSIFSALGNSDALELSLTPSASDLTDREKGRDLKNVAGMLSGDRMAVLGAAAGESLYRGRRILQKDIERAIGTKEREDTVVYVCAGRDMTDWIVEYLEGAEGMGGKEAGRIRCERWW